MALPAFAAERRAAALLLLGARCPPLSVDRLISCPHTAQQQTRRTPLLLSNDKTEKRTERRTDARRFIDSAQQMRAVSIMSRSIDLRLGFREY